MIGTNEERARASFDRGARLTAMMDGGMSEVQIAALEGINASAVSTAIHRHRKKVADGIVPVAGTIRKIDKGNFDKMVAKARPYVDANKGQET